MREQLPARLVNGDFLKIVMHLREDSVPNIRFNVCKVLETMVQLFEEDNRSEIRNMVENMQENDPDQDVRFYAARALRNEFNS